MRYGKWKSWFFAFLVFVLAFQCYPAATPVNADRLEETPAMLREAASQGMVLLKNEKAGSNTALPLAKGEKVALFGVGQVSFLPNGRGSSSVVVPYAVSGLEGMRNAAKEGKVSLVEDLSALYQKQVDDKIKDEMELTQSQIDSVAAKADTAIIYITRLSGEASDLTKKDDFVADNRLPLPEYPYNRSYFLSAKEKTMINQVKSAFKKVVVVLNVPSAVDTSWFNKDADIDAALVSWYPGMEGGNAVADVLTGAVNPSAKLPITFAGSLDDYESTKNFGTQTTIYEEDIFVGYRQFETFDPTYQKVNYPFGYGLSYTNFTITSSASASGGNINIQATVKNTGAVAGREVVQVYFSAPQKGTGGAKLSKAAKELACFQKTDMLQPGASQTVNLSFPVSDMASYDDTGVTGHKSTYVLEAGDYKIHVGNSIKKAGENGVKYTYKQSSTRVTEQCTQYLTPVTNFKKLEADGSYSSIAAGTGTADAPVNTNELYAPPISKITFGQVKSNRKLMEPFIAQIPSETLIEFLCTSVTAGNDLRDYGVPSCRMTDGSLGIRFNKTNDYEHWYPGNILVASTWDLELAQELATQLGKEMLRHEMLWAPALNIMRSPLCGRNFEYYSEDPLVSGKMAAAFTKGLQSQRKSVAMKHFAANNQEAYRTTNNVVATERALREIYLKGFEIAVKEAEPWGIMTSYNKINGVYTCQRYDLVTGIPRDEWGYQGFYTTDWGGDAAMTMTNAIKAGNDLRIGNYNEAEAELKASLYSKQLLRQDLELCTKRVLEMFLKTNAADQTEDAPGSLTIHPSGRNRLVATNYLSADSGIKTEDVKKYDSDKITPLENPVTDVEKQIAFFAKNRKVTYRLNIEEAGTYELAIRLSYAPGSAEPVVPLDIYLDGGDTPYIRIAGEDIPKTGYFKHTTVYTKIALPAGSHTFGVAAPSQDASRDSVYNLIDFTFNKAFPLATSGQQEFYATDFLGQSSYITVKDAYLDDVIPMDENEVYGLTKGRWVDYEIEVPRVGSYDITLYQKSEKENQALKLFLDGDDANPIATFKNTKTGTYEKVTATATLPVGSHRIRVRCDDTDGICSFVSFTFKVGKRLPLTITGAEKDGEGRITGITFANPANVAVPAKLILVSYQDRAATSLYTESIIIPASGGTVRLAGGPVECSGQVKCMLWDSLTGMCDLAQSYLIP